MWPALLGGLAIGALGYKGTKDQNVASAQQAQQSNGHSKNECPIQLYNAVSPADL